MKRIIAVFLSFLFAILPFSVCSYAVETTVNSESFFNQVKHMANTYDDVDGLSSETTDILYTNRLIVKTETNDPLNNYYDATEVVEGYKGLHILQYANKTQAENAYIAFSFEEIEYVEYDFYLVLSSNTSSDDELLENGHISWNSDSVQMDDAVNYIIESGINYSEVVVAIIDSGIYASHEFFNNDESGRIIDSDYIYEVNYRSKEDNTEYIVEYSSMEDDFYHGTHVGGILFDNTMENIKIVPYRVTNERGILYSDILSAFESILIRNNIVVPEDETLINLDLEDNIDIVNMSLGGNVSNIDKSGQTLSERISLAVENGMIIVAAAGNDSKNADFQFPACHPDVITVAATDSNNIPADFSASGGVVDIAAPGVDIKSPTPRTFEDDSNNSPYPAYDAFMTLSGTSMATPLVAAAAATLKSIVPNITPAEVKRIIKETAYVPENWEESCDGKNYGTGIVNFYNMVKAVLEPEYSVTPTIKVNSDNKFEITAPEGADCRIYYTLDGSVPTIDNHIKYTEPFNLRNSYKEKIIAVCHENGKLIGEPVSYDLVTEKTKTVFYKWSTNPLLNEDSEMLSCKINDPRIAAADDEGNITGLSPGDTKITYYMASGKRVVCDVNVIYAPWQWIIRILFLGFLWY